MSITIETNAKKVAKSIGRKAKKHIPMATKWALNNTAKKLQKAYKVQAEKKLDRPTNKGRASTVESFKIGFASPKHLQAFVAISDVASKYMKWAIDGGVSGKRSIPTSNRKLNDYGNIPNKKAGLVKGNQEIRKTKTGFGVWSAATKKAPGKLLVAFKSSVNYQKIFPFYKIGTNLINRVLPKEMDKSFKKMIRRS